MNEFSYIVAWSGLKTDLSLLGDRLSGQHPLSDASTSLGIEQGGLWSTQYDRQRRCVQKKRREAAQKRQARWRARHPGVEAAAKRQMRAREKRAQE